MVSLKSSQNALNNVTFILLFLIYIYIYISPFWRLQLCLPLQLFWSLRVAEYQYLVVALLKQTWDTNILKQSMRATQDEIKGCFSSCRLSSLPLYEACIDTVWILSISVVPWPCPVLHSTWNVLLVFCALRRSCSACCSHGVFWWGWGLTQYSAHLPLDPESVETLLDTSRVGLLMWLDWKCEEGPSFTYIALQKHQHLLLQILHLLLHISCTVCTEVLMCISLPSTNSTKLRLFWCPHCS